MSKNNLLISVIIPVYNGEKYIEDCLKNICEQTYQNIEVIVVNDGSTDKTKELIENYRDNRINKINIKNGGVSNARNIGIRNATGDYLMFVDSDDHLKDNAIERLVNIALNNSTIDIIRFNGFIQDEKGMYNPIEMPVNNYMVVNTSREQEKIINIFNSPYNSLRCYSPLLMIKNENITMFNTKLTYLEDKLFYLENMLKKGKQVLFLKENLYYYNYNTNSKTKNVNLVVKNINDIIEANNEISKVIQNMTTDKNIVNNSSLSLIIYRLEYFSEQMKYFEFRKTLKEVFNSKKVKNLQKRCTKSIKKTQKIQYFLLENNLYFLFYFSCKMKSIVKKMRERNEQSYQSKKDTD